MIETSAVGQFGQEQSSSLGAKCPQGLKPEMWADFDGPGEPGPLSKTGKDLFRTGEDLFRTGKDLFRTEKDLFRTGERFVPHRRKICSARGKICSAGRKICSARGKICSANLGNGNTPFIGITARSPALDAPRDEVSEVIAEAPETGGAQTPTGSGKDLTNLDLVRSVAVCCVVMAHIYSVFDRPPPGIFYGGIGVALFFVHTALVLMWSLERRPNTVDFYIRRIARIYPLAIVRGAGGGADACAGGDVQAVDGFFHYMAGDVLSGGDAFSAGAEFL